MPVSDLFWSEYSIHPVVSLMIIQVFLFFFLLLQQGGSQDVLGI
jgi:hypothetical protein